MFQRIIIIIMIIIIIIMKTMYIAPKNRMNGTLSASHIWQLFLHTHIDTHTHSHARTHTHTVNRKGNYKFVSS